MYTEEEFGDVILKKTPRCVAAAYETSFSDEVTRLLDGDHSPPHVVTVKHTVFGIKNDPQRGWFGTKSKIGCIIVHFLYDDHGHCSLTIDAVPISPHDRLSDVSTSLAPMGSNMQWAKHMDTLAGGRPLTYAAIYNLAMFDQEKCRNRDNETNPYDSFVNSKFRSKEIGPTCKRDLDRILSVINVAVEKNGGQVQASQLHHIGDMPPLQDR